MDSGLASTWAFSLVALFVCAGGRRDRQPLIAVLENTWREQRSIPSLMGGVLQYNRYSLYPLNINGAIAYHPARHQVDGTAKLITYAT
jgi:hypothetical protein